MLRVGGYVFRFHVTPKYLAISDMNKKIALRQRRFRIAVQREEHGYLTVGQLKVNGMKDSLNSYPSKTVSEFLLILDL